MHKDSSLLEDNDLTRLEENELIDKVYTGVAFDNFDRYVDTLNGKETLHDTVGIIYQNIDNDAPNESDVDSRSDQFADMLPPPAKRRRTFNLLFLNLF
ncbi:hypothetical protein KQX54_010589 [Cotesia glomerata]|uniref:Uncharacterized protein n=1 Tax=Cotesia glomerata TaxID=32391 RepID=A0AAV7ID50_COTGL|nr:hypothetical protein KQX54_010589 [Cotesia glomerata]